MPLYLAIDSGGTKADYLLADETRVLARTRSGTIKRMRTDAASAMQNLETALAALAAESGLNLSSVTRTCIGTAGNVVPLVTDFLRGALAARVGGELILTSDVEIALDAAFHGGAGVLVLAGTGSNVAGRTSAGELVGAGGWGPALADQGSGHRIGLAGVRAAFLALDEGGSTKLLDAITEFWKLTSIDELVAYANSSPSPDFSALVAMVLEAARAGDGTARAVLGKEGEDLGYLARLVLRRLHAAAPGNASVAFAGSIMKHVAPVREAVLAEIRTEFPDAVEMPGVIDPLEGALWRARQRDAPVVSTFDPPAARP